ncbi:hypothetical protein HYU15_01995 [Candidatus Woesearchaeota archaeon]|nr:hypothetical protein [Candidatus Woesearchaeota archaeon]
MSGKPESRLEMMLRPLRVYPVCTIFAPATGAALSAAAAVAYKVISPAISPAISSILASVAGAYRQMEGAQFYAQNAYAQSADAVQAVQAASMPDMGGAAFLSISLLAASTLAWVYTRGVERYLRDRRIIREHGFNYKHANNKAGTYCGRQALYAACIEEGYRKEFNDFINRMQKSDMALSWLPHF